jgi:4-hydroxy-tetrahydrodipicolinate reductase
MSGPVRIALLGASGRMGHANVRTIADLAENEARLTVAVTHGASPALGKDAGAAAGTRDTGVTIRSALPAAGEADVWIDFSSASAAASNAEAAAAAGAPIVVGTTGLPARDCARIADSARKVGVVFSPNVSVGVNVLLELVADAARALGSAYDIEIIETHHRLKRDSPSGTALGLAEALAAATGRDLAKTIRCTRQGDVGPRAQLEIGMQTIRGGDVVGDHTVHFLGFGDRIEITHRASSRETFAHGAVRAALWLRDRAAGLYDMRDVLGFR